MAEVGGVAQSANDVTSNDKNGCCQFELSAKKCENMYQIRALYAWFHLKSTLPDPTRTVIEKLSFPRLDTLVTKADHPVESTDLGAPNKDSVTVTEVAFRMEIVDYINELVAPEQRLRDHGSIPSEKGEESQYRECAVLLKQIAASFQDNVAGYRKAVERVSDLMIRSPTATILEGMRLKVNRAIRTCFPPRIGERKDWPLALIPWRDTERDPDTQGQPSHLESNTGLVSLVQIMSILEHCSIDARVIDMKSQEREEMMDAGARPELLAHCNAQAYFDILKETGVIATPGGMTQRGIDAYFLRQAFEQKPKKYDLVVGFRGGALDLFTFLGVPTVSVGYAPLNKREELPEEYRQSELIARKSQRERVEYHEAKVIQNQPGDMAGFVGADKQNVAEALMEALGRLLPDWTKNHPPAPMTDYEPAGTRRKSLDALVDRSIIGASSAVERPAATHRAKPSYLETSAADRRRSPSPSGLPRSRGNSATRSERGGYNPDSSVN